MKDTFSFYDIVAHVIPGAIGLAIVYWINAILASKGGQLPLPSIGTNDAGSSILFLIASYLVGTLAQAIGEGIEGPLLEWLWGWRSKKPGKNSNNPMVYLLCEPQSRFQFSKEFQESLKQNINNVFHLNLSCEKECEKELETTIKAHGLCYSLIMQDNAAQRSERIKAIFRLFSTVLTKEWQLCG